MRLEVAKQDPEVRLRAWQEMIRENFFGVDCKPDETPLLGLVEGRIVDSGAICRCTASRQRFSRTASMISRDASVTAVLLCVTGGTMIVDQGGNASVLNSGDMCILDVTRPFDVALASKTADCDVLHVPRADITKRVGGSHAAFATFGPTRPLQRLSATFFRGVTRSFEQFDTSTLTALIDQTLDLVALMVAQTAQDTVAPSTHKAATLVRVKAYIKAQLRDETLSIEQTSRALGISPRYINALLASEGTSFGRYVRASRLEGARREILDPARANSQITEIGFHWGFNNPSHFGRVFRERYGMSPREARAARTTS